MSDAVDHASVDATPARGMGFVPRAGRQPIIVLVVDESDDAELALLLGGGEGVAATDYEGSWSAHDDGMRVIVEFRLLRRGGEWERQWKYTDPGGSVLNAIAAGTHHVAIVPLVGDLSEFVRDGLRGAIVIDAQASGPITSRRDLLAPSTPTG